VDLTRVERTRPSRKGAVMQMVHLLAHVFKPDRAGLRDTMALQITPACRVCNAFQLADRTTPLKITTVSLIKGQFSLAGEKTGSRSHGINSAQLLEPLFFEIHSLL
jgi:hypothetical protein